MVTRVFVKLKRRTFIVGLADGVPRFIKERKVYAPGRPYEALYEASYWHHSAKMGPIPTQLIELAKQKQKREQKNENRT